ncbi:MAG: hypothetical protein C4567_07970 [Deltaproteobacteria bacterium]|nr:MAG: hypothetical protein C4567_07970 [Deltaproteobacteria bacterium]
MNAPKPKPTTPCGYPVGPIKAGDGTQYLVRPSGQMVRMDRKMGKAERKRHKRARRERRDGERAG